MNLGGTCEQLWLRKRRVVHGVEMCAVCGEPVAFHSETKLALARRLAREEQQGAGLIFRRKQLGEELKAIDALLSQPCCCVAHVHEGETCTGCPRHSRAESHAYAHDV